MNCFTRLLVLTLVLCVGRMPVPWGHSHSGMATEQLAAHLQQYHSATSDSELPRGWHWHIAELDLSTDGEEGESPVAVLRMGFDDSLVPMPDATKVTFKAQILSCCTSASLVSDLAHAVRQQHTYLRLNVLLI